MTIDEEVDIMLRQNAERERELFPEFDQVTGEGLPDERVRVTVTDLTPGGVDWLVPIALIEQDASWEMLLLTHSVHDTCQAIYGYYSNDLHTQIVPCLLRARAKHDFFFFAEFYWRIRPKDFGSDIPFRLRAIQMRFIIECEQKRLAGLPIRYIVLKARQAGISTVIDCYIGWYQIMWEKSKDSLIVGHQSDSSVEVEDMYKNAINLLPDYLFMELGERYDASKGKITGSKTQNISHIPSRNCKIKTGSAVNPEGARGGSSALIHYTEVAFWPETGKLNPRKLIKSATSATGGRPGTMVFFESTPNGQNFFKDEWDRAGKYDDYGNKVSAYHQFFIAWYMIDIYRTMLPGSTGYKAQQVSGLAQSVSGSSAAGSSVSGSSAAGLPTLREFAHMLIDRREDHVNGWDYLYWLWTVGATLEGIYWYMTTRREYQSADDMQQEFASDPIEAFKYAGTLEFDLYLTEKRKRSCKDPIFRGSIEGRAPKGEQSVQGLRLVKDDAGALRIWRMPDKKSDLLNRYLIGVDIGGKYATSDYSVITVFDRADMMLDDDGTLNEEAGPTVVAEWYGHTDPDLLAITCAQLAIFYDDALLVIEANTAYSKLNGTANDDVTELFFPVLLPLYDNVYSDAGSELDRTDKLSARYGFWTSRSKKVSIIKYLGLCLRDNLWVERMKDMFDEMQTYMKYPNGTYGAVIGKHDDRVMSRAIGLYVSRWEWDKYPVRPRHTRQQKQEVQQRVQQRRTALQRTIFNHN